MSLDLPEKYRPEQVKLLFRAQRPELSGAGYKTIADRVGDHDQICEEETKEQGFRQKVVLYLKAFITRNDKKMVQGEYVECQDKDQKIKRPYL